LVGSYQSSRRYFALLAGAQELVREKNRRKIPNGMFKVCSRAVPTVCRVLARCAATGFIRLYQRGADLLR